MPNGWGSPEPGRTTCPIQILTHPRSRSFTERLMRHGWRSGMVRVDHPREGLPQ
jgi:hypothetical protein